MNDRAGVKLALEPNSFDKRFFIRLYRYPSFIFGPRTFGPHISIYQWFRVALLVAVQLSEIEYFQAAFWLRVILRCDKMVDPLELDPLLALVVGHRAPLVLCCVTVIR